ncbi:uncharacterized protein VTP21DRAFT_9876 [Calcarisporiella thermophila]|uniref:uncharacterized protein n=1 Tax=Calcarisporiella thermophila TaxID=911321 RepID=UPI0037421CF5
MACDNEGDNMSVPATPIPPELVITRPLEHASSVELSDQAAASRKNRSEAASIGVSTALTRTLVIQTLHIYFRTPIKLFRPMRVDYLQTARALMPPTDPSKRQKRFSLRYTSVGMISHAVKTQGFGFLHRYLFPPLFLNTAIGSVLYGVYSLSLPSFHPPSSYVRHRTFPPPPFSAVFAAGALAGACQAVIAAPLDNIMRVSEVNELLEGKYRSVWAYGREKLRQLGWFSVYRGFSLTLIKDSLSCGIFFGVFEFVKQQGYYLFLEEYYRKQLGDLTLSLKENGEGQYALKKPHWMLEPTFILLAGAMAALAYQVVDHPLERVRDVFYIEEAQSEYLVKDANLNSRRAQAIALYKLTYQACSKRIEKMSALRFFYSGFSSTALRAVPASSVGFLAFEIVRRWLDPLEGEKEDSKKVEEFVRRIEMQGYR